MIVLEILFWLSMACMFHTYLLFPAILELLGKGRTQNKDIYSLEEELPKVTILLAAYNEEKVIEQKIKSTFNTGYPLDRIEFLIGSDASTDGTNGIVRKYSQQYPQLKLFEFGGRTGKAGIINQLAARATNKILILTDANVFFKQDTIYHLSKHYKNEKVSLVGGNILNVRVKKDGISVQEKAYLNRENRIKYYEGIIWGTMIGAFGGCYSVRKSHYAPVPPKFFMDDFYITMNVLEKKGKTINELEATCYEDVSNKITEEFRRKWRISIGNFQNLGRYKHLLWHFNGLAFCFWSHKVLRWLGPFFLLLMLISAGVLATQTLFYLAVLLAQIGLMLLPLLDWLLKKLNLHILWLRFISHFYLMNLALLIGFFKFINGVKSNVWTPTQRYQ